MCVFANIIHVLVVGHGAYLSGNSFHALWNLKKKLFAYINSFLCIHHYVFNTILLLPGAKNNDNMITTTILFTKPELIYGVFFAELKLYIIYFFLYKLSIHICTWIYFVDWYLIHSWYIMYLWPIAVNIFSYIYIYPYIIYTRIQYCSCINTASYSTN